MATHAVQVSHMAPAWRLLIADDHEPTRAGIRDALRDTEFAVVAEADSCSQAVGEASRIRPDVCLLEVRMPGGGVAAAREITRQVPQAAVVMLTVSDDRHDLLAALRAGARGYLLKSIDPDRLPDALRGVVRGEAPIPRALVTTIVDELRHTSEAPVVLPGTASQGGDPLTLREAQVLDLMVRGGSTAEIAARLFVSAGTVRTHLASALRKIGARDREAAVRMAKRPQGWFEDREQAG